MSTVAEGYMPALFEGGPGEVAAMLWRDPQVRTILAAFACLAVAALTVGAVRRVLHGREQARWRTGSRYVEIAAPGAVDEAGGAVFWEHLSALARPAWRRFWFGQPHVVWEIRVAARSMTVRVWVPSCIDTGLVEGAVQAAWPGAATTVTEAGPPLEGQTLVKGGRLTWPRSTDVPVAAPAGIDPMRFLLHTVSELAADSHLVVQIGARPASKRQMRRMSRSAWSNGQSGGSSFAKSLVNEALDFVQPGPGGSTKPSSPPPESAWVTRKRKILQERVTAGSLWSASVRWAMAMPPGDKARLKREVEHIAFAIHGLAAGNGVYRRRLRRPERTCNAWALGPAGVLNTPEVAVLAHLPYDDIVPVLERARARRVRAVEAVPSGGRGVLALGRVAQGGRKVGLHTADMRQHAHVVGSTGTGKSTFLSNLILGDIKLGTGVLVIDPKGDLINDVLDRLDPDQARGRLVLLDPAAKYSPGIVPLAGAAPDLVVEHLCGIWRNLFPRNWGSRAEHILRNCLRTLIASGEELTDLPALLTRPSYRKEALRRSGAQEWLAPFWHWWDEQSPSVQYQAMGPIVSRADALSGTPFMRATIGHPATAFDLGDALDNGGIVLARLPKGEIGDDSAKLLGSVLVSKAWLAAVRRAKLPGRLRPESRLYVDEAHNFLTLPYAVGDMLAEARGLHMGMVLAHQHLGQLPTELAEGISANARNKVVFNVSPEDAHRLARHTLPELGEGDLSRLDAFQAACRPVVGNVEQPAFTLTTDPPAPVVGKAKRLRREAINRPAFVPEPGYRAVPRQWRPDVAAEPPEGSEWDQPDEFELGSEWGEAA